MVRSMSKPRQHIEGYCMLYAVYFVDDPMHGTMTFRHHFRMNRKLCLDIVLVIWEYDIYFVYKKDCIGTVGFSSIQKCTSALRMLAYRDPADTQDDYMRMAESTAQECMYRFCKAVVAVFGELYLRSPTAEYTAWIMVRNAARGFPRMVGSIDSMHWL